MHIIIADRDENSAGRLGRILKGLSTDAEILHFSDPMYVVKYGLTNPVDMLFTEVRKMCIRDRCGTVLFLW